jgi:hypothetical protein
MMLPSLRTGYRVSILYRGGSEGSDNLVAADLRQGYRALPVITEEPASFLNGQKVRKK